MAGAVRPTSNVLAAESLAGDQQRRAAIKMQLSVGMV